MVTTTPTPTAAEAELSDVELRAWRGLVRAHDALVKRLDADLEAGHSIGLSSYEVLCALRSTADRKR